jgi:hypothetical protein
MTLLQQVRHIGLLASATALLVGMAAAPPASASAEEPAVGDCLDINDAWSSWSVYSVVDCTESHNSEVYEIVAYPADLGAPSTLTDEEAYAISDECSYEAFDSWLGSQDVFLPMKIWSWFIALPTDEQWDDGNRSVLCRTLRPTPSYDALSYRGALPDLFAGTPVIKWLSCTTKNPRSGADNPTVACTSKSKWLLLGGSRVKGKVTSKYPKDLQKNADKACAKNVKKYGKKGTKGIAALLSKQNSLQIGAVYAECFIPVASWNGKVK